MRLPYYQQNNKKLAYKIGIFNIELIYLPNTIMKKTFYIFILLLGTLYFAQGTANPFEESEKEHSAFEPKTATENGSEIPTQPTNGGNPGDPTPIDDYLPALAIAAVGIIVYSVRKKKTT
ncbi:hypothetical protein QGN23_07315 [Chryseobacterium gotjawalense]|uniref:Signal peptidase n=1 Tax=Chryseobacterium gotjawalense TaxID=3042315 RepID=A0ABY8RGR7_9FLAO|nr:hypothetical protein [Chryseobacterium sp. wdc7]WHF53071.1 hypothetical protein QGN23_07315 [Chryseobacterium sp. wdc7]